MTRQAAESEFVGVEKCAHGGAGIGAVNRRIGDDVHVVEARHAAQPVIAVPGIRAEKRLVDVRRPQLLDGADAGRRRGAHHHEVRLFGEGFQPRDLGRDLRVLTAEGILAV